MENPFQTPPKDPNQTQSESNKPQNESSAPQQEEPSRSTFHNQDPNQVPIVLPSIFSTSSRDVTPEDNPTLTCKVCKKPIQRAHHGDNRWVHIDDEVTLDDLAKGLLSSLYNHDPQPNYIEVTAREV